MTSDREVVVVVNQHSRQADDALARVHELLSSKGLRVSEIHVAGSEGDCMRHVKRVVLFP